MDQSTLPRLTRQPNRCEKIAQRGPDSSYITSVATVAVLWVVAGGGATVYWTNRTRGTIGRADVDASGNASNINQSFITGASAPIGVAVDAGHVCWANSGAGTIGRADVDASGNVSNINQSFITGANNPAGVAVDSLTSPGPGPPPPPRGRRSNT